jgi:dipeptidyl aminopeptidase/acylaminoacyl peptidase
MKAAKSISALAVGVGLSVTPTVAQRAPLRVEDVVAMRSFSDFTPITFSPDSKVVIYAVQDNRKKRASSPEDYWLTGVDGSGADIFVVQIATGEVTNLTGGGNNWGPSLSPDGRYLAFLSDRDGSGQAKLWILEVATRKMRKASEVIVRTNEIQWLPNSREVLLEALPADLTPAQFAQRMSGNTSRPASAGSGDNVAGATVRVYRSASTGQEGYNNSAFDAWNLDLYLRDLVLVDVSNGKARTVDHGHRIARYALSPDGSHVAVTIPNSFEKAGSQQILFDLDVFSLGVAGFRVLASDVRLRFDGSTFSWSPDSSRLVYQTGGVEATGDCYLVGLKGSAPKNITNLESPTKTGTAPFWDADGRHVYFLHRDAIWIASPEGDKATLLAKIPGHHIVELVTRNGIVFSLAGRALVLLTYDNELKESGFYKVDQQTGESAKLLQQSKSYAARSQNRLVTASPDGRLLAFFSEDVQHGQEIWLASTDFSNERRLTHINPQLDEYQMGAAQLIEWRSLDGEQLRGALLLPAGYTEGRSYPLIVCVYGGASLSSNLVQFGLGCGAMNMQLFATRGYAVLLPDAPQHLGTPMLDLAKTVLPGVDKVVDMGIADPTRLGVMGHSYGGYSVLSLIVQTKSFKAALAADGFGDLMASYGQMNKDGSAFGQSGAESGQVLMGGTPWQFPERYIENSPVFYLDRVETPLLIVHGAADAIVLPFLSDETFAGLRRLGKEVVYAKYEGEEHSPLYWSYANQLDFCHRVIAWFESHIKEQSPSLVKEHPAKD